MILITSWDDGHPLDERLADLLDRYGIKATFFVPAGGSKYLPVLSTSALRNLDTRFEVGSHTRDHVMLTGLSRNECARQIEDGKVALEQQLGRTVSGFCYPWGKWNRSVRENVVQAGFTYARTVECFRLDFGDDPYSVPTSCQFGPNRSWALLRNYLRHGRYFSRFELLAKTLRSNSYLTDMEGILGNGPRDSVFHLWGHSWEIEELGLWTQLERLLAAISSFQPTPFTIGELVAARTGHPPHLYNHQVARTPIHQ